MMSLRLQRLSLLALFSAQVWGQNTTVAQSNSSVIAAPAAPADCHCGFLDPTTGRSYTDSLIIYFNETQKVPDEQFTTSSYENPYEKGWTIFYRNGATPDNIYYINGSVWNINNGWLNMNVSAATPKHLVTGSELTSKRNDILYGTFRVFARSPAPYAGGTAFSMLIEHNDTTSAELDLMNMDDSTDNAWMATTTGGDYPQQQYGLNYTALENSSYSIGPWDFWEWRMDWNEESIDWYAGVNKTHTNSTSLASLVDTPAHFTLKHWSDGDAGYMQGPPTNDSAASVGYVRFFFNSSLASTASSDDTANCAADLMCSTEDNTLRITTTYPAAALQTGLVMSTKKQSRSKTVGIALLSASIAFTAALLLHSLLSRVGSKKSSGRPGSRKVAASDMELNQLRTNLAGGSSHTLLNDGGSPNPAFLGKGRGRTMSSRPLLNQYDSYAASSTTLGGMVTPQRYSQVYTPGLTPGVGPDQYWDPTNPTDAAHVHTDSPARSDAYTSLAEPVAEHAGLRQREPLIRDQTQTSNLGMAAAVPAPAPKAVAPPAPAAAQVPQARQRVDYLAGLVAMCSLLVSCTHFILTFVPSVIEEYLPQHYKSEFWARRTIEPFFFNEIWVGLFFTTSTRFLVTGYLRNGSLKGVAEKIVCRTPRLMIPITAVIIFEYFLMDVGATKYLEYVPSITWSTWPKTAVYTNFGWFLNETLQIIYLIPNAAPQLTWNYCTGVLWTIPVQLQNSWLVLLGVVIIREIKTPWKRFGYYTFCIINHWYAMSWGYYFWFGLMLADLDITYKYRKPIQSKAYLLYPMLCLACALVFVSLGNDLLSVWTGYTFSTQERGIHPEPTSALPLAQTPLAGYPAYTEPKLNGLVFCVAAQFIVELSVWVQKFLSTKPFLLLFPHVFTIYLIHGLVFWSIGSLVCVYFAGQNLPYWLNMLLTALICYATLFACLPVVTPVMEMLGKEMTKSVWVSASEEPVEWKPTSWPMQEEDVLIHKRRDNADAES